MTKLLSSANHLTKGDYKTMKTYDEMIANEYTSDDKDMSTLRLTLYNALLYYDELTQIELQEHEEIFHRYYNSITEIDELNNLLLNIVLQKNLIDEETLTELLQFTREKSSK